MPSGPTIGLVVDHPQRDLPGLVLVAHRLCAAGARVYLIPLNLLGAEVFSLVPDFLLLNYLRRNIEPVLHGCLDAGITIGVLDTEGGLYGDLGTYRATLCEHPDVRDALAVMCVWGRKMRDYLQTTGYVAEDRMVLTGSPRFDFYSSRWTRFHETRRPDEKPLVLINTKIAVANPQQHTVEHEIELYVKHLGMDRAEVMRHLEVGRQAIKATLDLANALARDYSDTRFVLRPHPHERLATYQGGLDTACPNLAAVREGTVDGWIVRSAALIHRHCTTAVEAAMAGVPALAPQWVPNSAAAPDTEAVSHRCGSYQELREVLDAVHRGEAVGTPAIAEALARIVDDWFLAVDGLAHERVAQAVLDRLPDRSRADPARAARYYHRLYEPVLSIRGAVGRTAYAGARAVPTAPWARLLHPHARKWPQTTKAFSAADVATLLARVETATAGGPQEWFEAIPASETGSYRHGFHGRSVVIRAVV